MAVQQQGGQVTQGSRMCKPADKEEEKQGGMLTFLVKCHDPLRNRLPDRCRQQATQVSLLHLDGVSSLPASAEMDHTIERSAAWWQTCMQVRLWRPSECSTAARLTVSPAQVPPHKEMQHADC